MARRDQVVFVAGLFIIFVVYFFTRYPMLNGEDSFRFYNSDFAIFSMMAEDIKEGRNFHFYYYGANYLGPLNSWLMMFTDVMMRLFGFVQSVPVGDQRPYVIGPLVSTITCFLTVYLGIVMWGLAFKRLFSVWESLAACLLLSLGSALLMRTSLRPLAPEIAFLLGGVITWRGLIVHHQNDTKNQFLFGFAVGFSWWMNQIVVFTVASLFFYWIAQTSFYAQLRNNLQVRDRFFLRTKALGFSSLHKGLKSFLQLVYWLALLNLMMGIVVSALGGVNTKLGFVKLKILNGFSPIKTSILIFVLTQFFLWLAKGKNSRQVLMETLRPVRFFFLGAAIGYGPVILGRLFNLYEKNYGPKFQFVSLLDLFPYWQKLVSTFIPNLLTSNLGLDISLTNILAAIFYGSLAVTFVLLIKDHTCLLRRYLSLRPGHYPIKSIFWGIAFFNVIYLALSERSRDQFAYRYAILTLPILAIFITSSFRQLCHVIQKKRILVLPSVLFLSYSCATYFQGRHQLQEMKTSQHHGDRMAMLMAQNCDVYFTNYWQAYLYEWLLQKQKKFAVIRGQDRTPKVTQKLKASDGTKCVIEDDWTIKTPPSS